MPGQGFSGLAGWNRFLTSGTPSSYGYWDTYGAGILPGGNLRVSPSQTGQPRSMPGIDIPVVGYPETGWNPNARLDYPYSTSIPGAGLPNRGDIGGAGLTPFDPLDYTSNPAPNENVTPTGNRFYPNTRTSVPTGSYGVPLQPFSSGDRYPDSPVTNPSYVSPDYPTPGFTPGVGYTSPMSNNWAENAASGYGFAGRIRGALNRLVHSIGGTQLGVTPTGSQWYAPVSGENWIGGGFAGTDPVTGRKIWNPLGTIDAATSGGFGGQSRQDRGGFGGSAPTGSDQGAFGGGTLGIAGLTGGLARASIGFGYGGGAFPTFSGGFLNNARAMAGPLQP